MKDMTKGLMAITAAFALIASASAQDNGKGGQDRRDQNGDHGNPSKFHSAARNPHYIVQRDPRPRQAQDVDALIVRIQAQIHEVDTQITQAKRTHNYPRIRKLVEFKAKLRKQLATVKRHDLP